MDSLKEVLRIHDFDSTSLIPIDYGGAIPIYQFTIPFSERSNVWLRLRELVNQLGYWPVITDHIDTIKDYQVNDWADAPADILEQAAKQDPLKWLLTRARESVYPSAEQILSYCLEELESMHMEIGDDLVAYDDIKNDILSALSNPSLWSRTSPPTDDERLGLRFDALPPEWYPSTYNVVLFPTKQWWEIAAMIRYYPADPGPEPVTHVMLWQWWARRYGAELVYMTRGGFTLRTRAFPSTPSEALTLAWEHSVYCNNFNIPFLSVMDQAPKLYHGEAWAFGWVD